MERSIEIQSIVKDILELGEADLRTIGDSIGLTHQISPIDGSQIFARMEKIISVSDDLSWIISSINRKKLSIENELKKIKDPKYVSLVRQNRPSSAAIETEIRITIPEVSKLEDNISLIDNVIVYLDNVQKNLDRYLSLLKSKSSFIR